MISFIFSLIGSFIIGVFMKETLLHKRLEENCCGDAQGKNQNVSLSGCPRVEPTLSLSWGLVISSAVTFLGCLLHEELITNVIDDPFLYKTALSGLGVGNAISLVLFAKLHHSYGTSGCLKFVFSLFSMTSMMFPTIYFLAPYNGKLSTILVCIVATVLNFARCGSSLSTLVMVCLFLFQNYSMVINISSFCSPQDNTCWQKASSVGIGMWSCHIYCIYYRAFSFIGIPSPRFKIHLPVNTFATNSHAVSV
jgi:hypothetical protein